MSHQEINISVHTNEQGIVSLNIPTGIINRDIRLTVSFEIMEQIVSAWEIVIKAQIGKLPLPETPDIYIPSRIAHYDFQTLSIEMVDVLQIWQLETHHKVLSIAY